MNGCEAVRELLCEWLDGELPADEREAVARHLDGCAACRRELETLKEAAAAVHGLPRRSAPPGVLTGVRAGLREPDFNRDATASTAPPVKLSPKREAPVNPWRAGWLSVAALLALAVLIYTAYVPHLPENQAKVTPPGADATREVTSGSLAPTEPKVAVAPATTERAKAPPAPPSGAGFAGLHGMNRPGDEAADGALAPARPAPEVAARSRSAPIPTGTPAEPSVEDLAKSLPAAPAPAPAPVLAFKDRGAEADRPAAPPVATPPGASPSPTAQGVTGLDKGVDESDSLRTTEVKRKAAALPFAETPAAASAPFPPAAPAATSALTPSLDRTVAAKGAQGARSDGTPADWTAKFAPAKPVTALGGEVKRAEQTPQPDAAGLAQQAEGVAEATRQFQAKPDSEVRRQPPPPGAAAAPPAAKDTAFAVTEARPEVAPPGAEEKPPVTVAAAASQQKLEYLGKGGGRAAGGGVANEEGSERPEREGPSRRGVLAKKADEAGAAATEERVARPRPRSGAAGKEETVLSTEKETSGGGVTLLHWRVRADTLPEVNAQLEKLAGVEGASLSVLPPETAVAGEVAGEKEQVTSPEEPSGAREGAKRPRAELAGKAPAGLSSALRRFYLLVSPERRDALLAALSRYQRELDAGQEGNAAGGGAGQAKAYTHAERAPVEAGANPATGEAQPDAERSRNAGGEQRRTAVGGPSAETPRSPRAFQFEALKRQIWIEVEVLPAVSPAEPPAER